MKFFLFLVVQVMLKRLHPSMKILNETRNASVPPSATHLPATNVKAVAIAIPHRQRDTESHPQRNDASPEANLKTSLNLVHRLHLVQNRMPKLKKPKERFSVTMKKKMMIVRC
jgi:Tfp pilus assembly protein FimV